MYSIIKVNINRQELEQARIKADMLAFKAKLAIGNWRTALAKAIAPKQQG